MRCVNPVMKAMQEGADLTKATNDEGVVLAEYIKKMLDAALAIPMDQQVQAVVTCDGGMICLQCVHDERAVIDSAIENSDYRGGWLPCGVDEYTPEDLRDWVPVCDHCGYQMTR